MVVQTDDPTFKPLWVSKIPTLLRRTKKTTNCNVNWLLHECSDQIPSSEKGSKPYQTRGDAFCFIQLAC
jgi:hypothetical protein